ncbi:MAG: TatD family hydrolase [Candidatus Omnitrophota bacterium]
MLVDSHCHLNSLPKEKSKDVVEWFNTKGNKLIDSSIDLETSQDSIYLSSQHSFIYNSLGFHPFNYYNFSDRLYKKYKKIIEENNKIVALGEVGLDYKANLSLSQQEAIFKKWLILAKETGLTVLIHYRLDNHNWHSSNHLNKPMILTILDDFFSDYKTIVFHCFSYSHSFLAQIVEKGGFVSFSLNLLRGNKRIINSLQKCPVNNLLLETDSPYMKIKGKLSTPKNIESVYSYVSKLKGISRGELEERVFYNAKRAFRKI